MTEELVRRTGSPLAGVADYTPRRTPDGQLGRIGVGYTRFVGLMKLLLPLVAGILVALVVVWPQVEDKVKGFRLGFSGIGAGETSGQRMINARFTGSDDANRPYTITAEAAVQSPDRDDLVELEFPKADITLPDGAWLALAAQSGVFLKTRQTLELSGDVNLFHDSGYEIHTARAHIDMKRGTASGDAAVAGQGPLGTVKSEGFRLLDRGRRILFTGKARLVLFPGPPRPAKRRGGK